MGRVIIPYLNPLNIVRVEPQHIPQYNTYWTDVYFWKNRLDEFQAAAPDFYQPWQHNDVVSIQFQNNAGQITVEIKNCEGFTVNSFIMTQKQQNVYQPDYFIYEMNAALNTIPSGRYFFVFKVGVNPISDVLVSEPILVQEKHENTVLLQYTNRRMKGKFIFETGIKPSIRVPSRFRQQAPGSNDTLYEDQTADMVMIKSIPFRLWRYYIESIPDWFAWIIKNVQGCSDVKYDGLQMVVDDDAKFESTISQYSDALVNYQITLREAVNNDSKDFDSNVVSNDEISIMLNVDSKGFADTSENASSSIVTFIDVN